MAHLLYFGPRALTAEGVHHHPRILHEAVCCHDRGPAPLVCPQFLHLFTPVLLKALLLGSMLCHVIGDVDPQGSAVLSVVAPQRVEEAISVADYFNAAQGLPNSHLLFQKHVAFQFRLDGSGFQLFYIRFPLDVIGLGACEPRVKDHYICQADPSCLSAADNYYPKIVAWTRARFLQVYL